MAYFQPVEELLLEIVFFFVSLHPFWEHSSAGSERMPYKHEVTGSIPVTPTVKETPFRSLFYFFLC